MPAPAYQAPQPQFGGPIIAMPFGSGFTHFSGPGFSGNCINLGGIITCR